jgi:hypothetical protein
MVLSLADRRSAKGTTFMAGDQIIIGLFGVVVKGPELPV